MRVLVRIATAPTETFERKVKLRGSSAVHAEQLTHIVVL